LIPPLSPGQLYHIYNHAIGSEKLFVEEQNYFFFLDKFNLYLTPVARFHAYCLMPNHFHVLMEIRAETELLSYFDIEPAFSSGFLEKKVSKCFSNFFNAYTQAFNKLYNRMGGLFMQNFNRKPVLNIENYTTVVRYIHNNPVHHGYCKHIADWKFSSYNSLLSHKNTLLERASLLTIFGGRDAFIAFHQQFIELKFDFRL
jgi:putative transposase